MATDSSTNWLRPRWLLILLGSLAVWPFARADSAEDLPEHAKVRLGSLAFSHRGRIQSIGFSASGNLLVGHQGAEIRIWQLPSGKEIGRIHNKVVGSRAPSSLLGVCFTDKEEIIASCDKNNGYSIWNWKTNDRIHHEARKDGSRQIAHEFSSERSHLCVARADGEVRLFDLATRKQIGTTIRDPSTVRSISFSRQKMVVAAGNAKGYVTIWDANTGERREQLKIGAMPIRVVEFSADGTTMVVAESGQGVTIWRGQPLREVKAIRMDGLITSMRLSRCGKYVAVAKSDGTLGIWEVETATLTRSLEEVTGWINCLAFSDDGSVLAAAGADYTVALWEWRKGRLLNPRRGHGGRITAIAFAPEKVVTAGTDFAVYGWDMKGTIKDVIKAPGTRDRALAPMMARGRSVLAVSRETSRVDVYEFPAMRRLFTMPIDNMAVEALALTVDDQVLAVGGQIIRDGRPESVVKLFKASSGKLSHEIRPESELVTSLRFSPGGDNLIVRHSTRTEVWDVLTRQRRYTLRHAIASIMAADCGPKDDWFVIDDPFTASVEMRSFKDGSQMQRFGGVNTGILVQSVAVAPDGRLVATGSARGTIDLWNVASGEKVGTFSSQNGGVIRTLCFSDDGSMLASGSDDTTVLLWDVKVYQKPDR